MRKPPPTRRQDLIAGGMCAWHRPSELGYVAWQDAKRRDAAGEKQRQCPTCKRWLWPDEYGEEPT